MHFFFWYAGCFTTCFTSSEENSRMRCGFIVPGEVKEGEKSSNTWLHPGLHQEVGFQVAKCPTAPKESTQSSGCGGGVPGWPQAVQTLEHQPVQSVKPPHPVWHADIPVLQHHCEGKQRYLKASPAQITTSGILQAVVTCEVGLLVMKLDGKQ